MKKSEKYIVFRNKESGAYLVDYKIQGTLAYESNYTWDIKRAALISFEAFEEQRKQMKLLAKTMGCEILVVEATYNLKHLNGEDAKEIEKEHTVNGKSLVDLLHEVGIKMGLDKAGE
ncbi:hypothetical protein [uncultured Granulicatella sp.]|uniref:hypothetical protein n=1 Tax=uncultured Granulicatella sp. TaxID=316089 RepID=UPI0028CFF243|nr:hypothetical protein [uncultured Granulicatella sp.]